MSDEQGEDLEVSGTPEPSMMPAEDPAPGQDAAPAQDQTPEPDAAPEPVMAREEPDPVPSAPVGEPPVPQAKGRTGLFVVVGLVLLLLVAFVVAGPMLFSLNKTAGSSSSTTATSPTKAKVSTAIDFVKALLNGDTLAIKSFLRDDARNAITEDQWAEIAAQDTTSAIKYDATVWTGDTTAVVRFTAPAATGAETTGTMTFAYDETDPLTVTMSAAIGDTTEVDKVQLEQAGNSWRVVSISNGTQTTTFDAALIKSMVDTSTAGASGTPAPSKTTTP